MKIAIFVFIIVLAHGSKEETSLDAQCISKFTKGFIEGLTSGNTDHKCQTQLELLPKTIHLFTEMMHQKNRSPQDFVYALELLAQNGL